MLKKIDPARLVRHVSVRKWAGRLAMFMVALGVLGFLVMPPLVKWLLVDQLGQALQREVTVRSVSINPYALSATIRGLSVLEKTEGAAEGGVSEVAGFDVLRLNLETRSLFLAGIVVKEVELLAPRLRLTRLADGRYNFSDLIDAWSQPQEAADNEGDGKPPRFSVSNIQIAGGRLEFDDRLKEEKHVVDDLTLRLPFISSLPFHAESYVEPHFSAMINGAPLTLSGRSRPFAESHESELSLDLDKLELPRYWAYVPVELPIRIDSGTLGGKLQLRFVQAPEQPPRMSIGGNLALEGFRMSAAGGAPLLSIARIDLGVREIDPIARSVAIEKILVESPEIDAAIDRAGRLDWLSLLSPAGGKAKGEKPAPAAGHDGEKPPMLRLALDLFEVKGGALSLRDVSTGSAQRLKIGDIRFRAGGYDSAGKRPVALQLSASVDAGEHLRVQNLSVDEASLDLGKRVVELGNYSMHGVRIKVGRDKAGQLEFLRPPRLEVGTPMAGAPAAGAGKGRQAPAASPWQMTVRHVKLTDHALTFEDSLHTPAAVQTLALDTLQLDNLSTLPGAEARLSAKMRINRHGNLDVDGRLQPLRPSASLQLTMNRLELLPLQPYFAEKLNLTVTRGQLSAKGEFRLAPGKEGPSVAYRGSLSLADFNSVDKLNSTGFLRWKSFHLAGIDVASAPPSVAIDQVALSDFFARVIVDPEGRLNLLHLVKRDGEEAAPSSAANAAGTPPATASVQASTETASGKAAGEVPERVLPVRIGRVTLQGGRVAFTDNFVKPNYSANLTQLAGRVSGLSSQEGSVADLELRGSYNDLAPLTVTARINPFAAKRYLDLDAEVKGVELTGFSPYSGKYAGYAIDKGKLSLFLKYRINDRQLLAENRVFLDQLTFGQPVESPDATSLPVNLAVALLKNRAGEIDINLPISGSLDDPDFSVGGIVVKVVVNLVVKAVTSPFALLGSVFGGGAEMAYVDFDHGRARLAPAMVERMRTLAAALADRPGLRIELSGRIDPDKDREGLKKVLLERRVKAQRLQELVKQGTEAGSVDDIDILPKDYARYLEKAYKAEKFPKPRNMVGLEKSLPVEEMEKLMLAHMDAGDEALRQLADRRARNVAQWLTAEGQVAAERVFVLQPNLVPSSGPQQEGASASRVDFSLK